MAASSVAMRRFRRCFVLFAMAGIYGLTALLVNRRTGELGLRMAPGCALAGVARLAMVCAMTLAAAGLVAGRGWGRPPHNSG